MTLLPLIKVFFTLVYSYASCCVRETCFRPSPLFALPIPPLAHAFFFLLTVAGFLAQLPPPFAIGIKRDDVPFFLDVSSDACPRSFLPKNPRSGRLSSATPLPSSGKCPVPFFLRTTNVACLPEYTRMTRADLLSLLDDGSFYSSG